MTLPVSHVPLQRDPFVSQTALAALMGSHFDEEQRVWPLGHRDIGSDDSVIRFRAARACQFVRVHVQSTAASGGGVLYSPMVFISSTQYDMRANRQRDVTVERNGVDRYYVWLIPEFLESDGTFTKYDGLGDNIVGNSGFATDTLWSKGTGWTIAAGVATKAPGVVGAISQGPVATLSGTSFRFYFTMTAYAAGTLTPDVGTTAGTARSATGHFVENITSGATSDVSLLANGAFDGSIDNVGVFQIDALKDHMAFADLGV